MAYETRDEVAGKIEWEGGYEAVLQYGLQTADMPAHDTELRFAWAELEEAYRLFVEKRDAVQELLEEDE